MSEASYTDVQSTLGDTVSAVPLDTLTQNMRLASILVQDEGVETTNTRFKILHIYKTAHLLHQGGYIKGPVTSEAVADVSLSYAGPVPKFSSQWDELYQKAKVNVLGLCDRVL